MVLAVSAGVNQQTGFNEYTALMDNFTKEQKEQEATLDEKKETQNWFQNLLATSFQSAGDIWDTTKLLFGWAKIFIQGFADWDEVSIEYDEASVSYTERLLILAIKFFRATLLALVIFEAYLIWRNRKTGA